MIYLKKVELETEGQQGILYLTDDVQTAGIYRAGLPQAQRPALEYSADGQVPDPGDRSGRRGRVLPALQSSGHHGIYGGTVPGYGGREALCAGIH